MVEAVNAGQIFERRAVCAHNGAPVGACSCGDDQVVRAARPTRLPDGNQQLGVVLGNAYVVRQDRYGCCDVIDVVAPSSLPPTRRERNANPQFGEGDGRDRDIVIIADHLVNPRSCSLGIDQERRVE